MFSCSIFGTLCRKLQDCSPLRSISIVQGEQSSSSRGQEIGPMTPTFTPENSALVLIDHQVGTMQLIKNIDVAQARRMSLALAKTARILGIPTVLTSSQEDRVQGPLLHELKDILPDALEKRIKSEGIVNAWT